MTLAGALLWLGAVAALPATAAESPCRLDLPPRATQGALVVGRADPQCRVTVGTRTLRLAPDGSFVFGLGRDAPAEARVTAQSRDGNRETRAIAVAARAWPVERVDGVPQSTVTPDPALAARIAREQAEVAKARERDDAREDFRFGFVRPAEGRISGVYGSQRILNGTPKDPHYGLDIAAPTGTTVRAPAAGIVTFAKSDLYLTGGTLLLDHGHGLSSVFIHLSRIAVQPGQRVEQGDAIAAVGATGRASGPHLHWGMNWFDTRIDPALLIEDAR